MKIDYKLIIWLWRHVKLIFENNALIISIELLSGLVNWLDCEEIEEFTLNFTPNYL